MKRIIITMLFFLVVLVGAGQVKCHIKGELRDTTRGRTVVIGPGDVDIRVSDNYITVKADAQGRFSCDVEAAGMDMYKVFLHEEWKQGSWHIGKFLVEDGATVTLCFDDKQWHVISGGPEQTLKINMETEAEQLYLSRMNAIQKQAEAEIRPRVEELQAEGKNPEGDSLLMKRYRECMTEYEKLFKEYRAWEQMYYAAHPMQYALYDIAHQMQYMGGDDKQMAGWVKLYHAPYENFHPENAIHNTIRTLESAWLLKPGKPYIDFEARTAKGKKVQVSSFYRDKVAVIDLWASWCGPCRQHSAALIPLYEKYKNRGFTVVGIAREEEVSSMTKTVEKDGYPWQNLVDIKDELKVWQKNGLSFAGGGMFLIDRDGIILSTSTEADELEPLICRALGLPEPAPAQWKAEAEQNRVEKDPAKSFVDFSVVYQGKTTRFSDYVGRGRYVLVDFWASWCPPCLEEIPNLIAAYNKYESKGLLVLGVAVSDKPAYTEASIKELGINYPQIINAQDVASKAYGIKGIPQIILFAPDGSILARGLRGEDIEKKLAEIFKGE